MYTPEETKYYAQQPLPEATPNLIPHEPTPDDPPWTSGAAIGIWVLSVLAIVIFPLFFIVPYFLLRGLKLPEDAATDPTVILLGLAAVVPAHLFTLAAAWPVVTKFRKYPFLKMLGWQMGGVRWWFYPLTILGLITMMVGVTQIFPEQDNDLLKIIRSSPAAAYSLALLATLFAPFVEELVYRGLMYSAFRRAIGTGGAVAAVTMLFASVHYLQYWGSWGSIIAITVLSLVLTLTRAMSKNLLPCVILHFIFNALQSVGIIASTFVDEKTATDATAFLHLIGLK